MRYIGGRRQVNARTVPPRPAARGCPPRGASGEALTCRLNYFPDGYLSAASIPRASRRYAGSARTDCSVKCGSPWQHESARPVNPKQDLAIASEPRSSAIHYSLGTGSAEQHDNKARLARPASKMPKAPGRTARSMTLRRHACRAPRASTQRCVDLVTSRGVWPALSQLPRWGPPARGAGDSAPSSRP